MQKNNLLKYFGIFLGAFLIVFLLFISIPKNDLVVKDQPKGVAIHIKKASLVRGGFVVVMATNPNNNLPDETLVLNDPVYMPAGIYKDFDVRLKDPDVSGIGKVGVALYEDVNGEPGYFEILSEDGKKIDVSMYLWYGKLARKVINVY